jgi:hypothetical protein
MTDEFLIAGNLLRIIFQTRFEIARAFVKMGVGAPVSRRRFLFDTGTI